MKKYRVNVNGSLYEIEIEEMDASAAKRAPAAAPAPAAKPAAAPVGAGTKVNAPMPGTILDVKVQAGQSVKRGQEGRHPRHPRGHEDGKRNSGSL